MHENLPVNHEHPVIAIYTPYRPRGVHVSRNFAKIVLRVWVRIFTWKCDRKKLFEKLEWDVASSWQLWGHDGTIITVCSKNLRL